MWSTLRQTKSTLQELGFGAIGRPVVGLLNRAATRWLNFALNRDNDPELNGEYWLVDAAAPDGTYLDVGYNSGDWTRRVLAAKPRARVFAFDPDPGAGEHARAERDARFEFVPAAVGAKPGTARFVSLGPANPSNSLARPHHGAASPDRAALASLDVEVVRLDEWATRRGVDRVALLKIDAEGYDLEVMRGAERLFEQRAIELCVFEYGYGWLETGALLAEAAKYLGGHGYELYRLFPRFLAPYRWAPTHENAVSGQFVALPAGRAHLYDVRAVAFGL